MKQHPFEEGKFYHIFNRGNNKENIFIEERNYVFFLQKIYQYLLPICNIYAYCLMPNHFHLVVQIKEFEDMPHATQKGTAKLHQPFSNLFNSYTKAINKAYNRTGSLFREHLHRNPIDNITYLRDVIIYTLLNPESHGFAENYKFYTHSSFSEIMNNNSTVIKRKEVLALFEDIENFVFCIDSRKYKNEEKLKEILDNDY
ncbi:MAG: transposase [Bacteroidales bacterium]|nr:transposase [Bacteroidales bacterium]